MRTVIVFILCLSISIICLSLAIPVPPNPHQPPENPDIKHGRIVMISGVVLNLMKEHPFDSFSILTMSEKGEFTSTSIPSWNDIAYSIKLNGDKRRYFIFRKVFKALNRDYIKRITVSRPPAPNNLKV
jgi:hypothetical protein